MQDTDTRDPVTAAIEAWPSSLSVAEQEVPAFLQRLAEQGYVLVNLPRLEAQLSKEFQDDYVAAILAAIQEQGR
jgi:hypothetical protein